MTIAEKLQSILNSKNDIKIALQNKGLTPGNELATYASLIDSLLINTGEPTFPQGTEINIPNNTLVYNGKTYNLAEVYTEPICYIGKYETTDKYFRTLDTNILIGNSYPELIESGVEKTFTADLNCIYILVPEGYTLTTFLFTNEFGVLSILGGYTKDITYNDVNYVLYGWREADFTTNPEIITYKVTQV